LKQKKFLQQWNGGFIKQIELLWPITMLVTLN